MSGEEGETANLLTSVTLLRKLSQNLANLKALLSNGSLPLLKDKLLETSNLKLLQTTFYFIKYVGEITIECISEARQHHLTIINKRKISTKRDYAALIPVSFIREMLSSLRSSYTLVPATSLNSFNL